MWITEDVGDIYVDLSSTKRMRLNAESAEKIRKIAYNEDGSYNSEVSFDYDDFSDLVDEVSNCWNLAEAGDIIAENTDLNTMLTPGTFIATVSIASTCTNVPYSSQAGFKLMVIQGYAANYMHQMLFKSRTGQIYTRTYYNNQNPQWSSWRDITQDTTNVIAGNGLTGGGSAASETGVTLNVGAGAGITVAADQVKAKLRSETALTVDSAAATTTSGRVYPVAVDKTGYLAVNVPWTDTDTNTHYTTKLFATSSSGTAHAATTNGNTYLRLFDDSTARQSIKITGSGATTVTSDANGVITISSTDTNTNTNYYHTPSYTAGLSIASGTGVNAMYVPYGTASQYGLVKPNAVRTSAITATNGGTTSNRYYGVEMDSNGKLFVNVPWTDTDTNTDTKVTQTVTTSNASYPLLLAPTGQTETTTTTSYFDSGVTLNPSTNTIAANISGSSASCTGNAATATTASACSGNSTTATTATNATNVYINSDTSSKIYVLGATTTGNTKVYRESSVYMQSNVLYGAAWNDYAEYRETKETIAPGRVICENGDDTLSLATERLQPGASVVSDTFGFTIGETEKAKTPIAVSGRVLVYPYEDRYSYKPGDAVCAAPNGTVSKMTREEIREYPERIVGTVSAIPEYETWGEGNVPVNGRIWIKVR